MGIIFCLNNIAMENKLINKIIETVCHIEKYPLMHMPEKDYKSLKNYLMGYLFAVDDTLSLDLVSRLSKWLPYPKRSSLYWTEYIYVVLAKKDETLAYQLTTEKLKEFLNSLLQEE